MKESDFQKHVIDYLKQNGYWFVKYWGGGVFTKEGVPDIIACIKGKFHGIELKTDTGTETKLQAYNLHNINLNHGYGYVLRPMKIKGRKHKEYSYGEYTFEAWKEMIECNSAIPE